MSPGCFFGLFCICKIRFQSFFFRHHVLLFLHIHFGWLLLRLIDFGCFRLRIIGFDSFRLCLIGFDSFRLCLIDLGCLRLRLIDLDCLRLCLINLSCLRLRLTDLDCLRFRLICLDYFSLYDICCIQIIRTHRCCHHDRHCCCCYCCCANFLNCFILHSIHSPLLIICTLHCSNSCIASLILQILSSSFLISTSFINISILLQYSSTVIFPFLKPS